MSQSIQSTLIQKNDLIKDYINFALVIILSLFFKYSALELAESIWFFSVVLAVSMLLFQAIKCFEPENFALSRISSILLTGFFYIPLYIGELLCIRDILGYKEIFITIKEFVFYIPFIPFVLYANRKHFKYFLWEHKINKVSLSIFLIWLKLFILFVLIYFLQQNTKFAYSIIYTIFFFPIGKTMDFIQLIKQQKEVK